MKITLELFRRGYVPMKIFGETESGPMVRQTQLFVCMRRFLNVFASLAAALAAFTGAPSSLVAETVNFTIAGEVTRIDPQLEAFFELGDLMSASVTYESSVPPSGGNELQSFYLDAITDAFFTVGNYDGEIGPTREPDNEIDVTNCTPGPTAPCDSDSIRFIFGFQPSLPDLEPFRFDFTLIDLTGNVFDSVALPDNISLIEFSRGGWEMRFFAPFPVGAAVGGRIFLEPVIDVKPGSKKNQINTCGSGSIRVAIFGSNTFDVRDIDLSTVLFAEAGIRQKGNKDIEGKIQDVNRDGIADIIVSFNVNELELDTGLRNASLVGETFSGITFRSADIVEVKKLMCKRSAE